MHTHTIPLNQSQDGSCQLSSAHNEGPDTTTCFPENRQSRQNVLDVHRLSQCNIPLPAMPGRSHDIKLHHSDYAHLNTWDIYYIQIIAAQSYWYQQK